MHSTDGEQPPIADRHPRMYGQERTAIGEAIAAALEQQDSSYDLTYRGRYDQLTVYARFSPLSGTARQRLQVPCITGNEA